jgi:hypothetical protein
MLPCKSGFCQHSVREPMAPNYALERTGSLSTRARDQRARHLCAPSARLKRLRPAAQRER